MIKTIRNKLKHRKSVSDNVTYPAFCLSASKDEKIFSTFRKDKTYQYILEHLDINIARNYFELTKKEHGLSEKEIYSYVQTLNKVGSPELEVLSSSTPPLSTTGLRYLYTALEIKKFVNSTDHNVKNIIELGCGYGGQSILLNNFFEIESYTYVDLIEVNKLIEKFTSHFSINFSKNFLTLNDKFEKNYDLVISNYSFSELPRHLQLKSIKKILNQSKMGYLIINSENFTDKYNFLKRNEYEDLFKNYEIKEEKPQTSSKNVNFVYTFIN